MAAVFLELASVTDSLVTFATHVIRDLGLGGVLLLTTTTGVIGLPGTEPTMLFAGFDVYQGNLSLFVVNRDPLAKPFVCASIRLLA